MGMCIPTSLGRIHTESEHRWLDEWWRDGLRQVDWIWWWEYTREIYTGSDVYARKTYEFEKSYIRVDWLWWMNMAPLWPWMCTWPWACTLVSLCLYDLPLLVLKEPTVWVWCLTISHYFSSVWVGSLVCLSSPIPLLHLTKHFSFISMLPSQGVMLNGS